MGKSVARLLVGGLVLAAGVYASRLWRADARIAGNESAAITALRTINAAQLAYASSCAAAGFAQSLDDLAKPPSGSAHAFLDATLGRNGIVWRGYVFTMQSDVAATIVTPVSRVCNAPAAHAMSAYFVAAAPASAAEGRRTFATDKRGTIFMRTDGDAITRGMYGAVPVQ